MSKRLRHNLGKLRTSAGISQEKLAEKMSVARQTISKWENGETYPSTEHILKLSDVLGCNIGDLVGEEKTEKRKIFIGGTALAIMAFLIVFFCGFVTATAIMYFCEDNDGHESQCEVLEKL